MLLSIVECSDYRKTMPFPCPVVERQFENSNIEVIGPVSGVSVAQMRNRGARMARGQWIFFKDEDCHIDIPSIVALIKRIKDLPDNFGAVGGVYQNKSHTIFAKTYSLIQKKWVYRGLGRALGKRLFVGDHLLGGALLVKAEAYSKTKGFCERIGWGGEETQFVQQIQKLGYLTGVSYKLRVLHKNPLSLGGLVKRAWFQNFNRGRFAIPRSKNKSSRSYLTTSQGLLAPTYLFFVVSQVACGVGHLRRVGLRSK